MMRVLITGATGFVGRLLCEVLARSGYLVRAALRREIGLPPCVAEKMVVGDLAQNTDWRDALVDVDFVIHLAARAHILNDAAANSDLYVATNAAGTRHLAEAAATAGVRRFVFLSSIKVNGEQSLSEGYTPTDEPRPQDAYAISKLLAEQSLAAVSASTGIEVSSVRAPLVYGPGVRANFLRLMDWIDKGWPLPLGAIDNRRSLVSIWNLCDLLVTLLEHRAAAGRTWMVSDGHDVSTPELLRRLGGAMNRPVRLWPLPVTALRWGGGLLGREAEIARLCGSLVGDITETRRELHWSPPVGLDEGLARTADWYFNRKS